MIFDLKYALRALLRAPGYSCAAIATMALGIGASTAIFSVANAVIFAPLPYPASERLVAARLVVDALADKYPTLPVNARFFEEWRSLPAFGELSLIQRDNVTLTGVGEPMQLSAVESSANLFLTLGVSPVLGRAFLADDDKPGRAGVAVISDRLWRGRFATDPAVLGRTVKLRDEPYTIVGVLPPGFRFPTERNFLTGRSPVEGEAEVFLPKLIYPDERQEIFGRFNYDVVGRLAPTVGMKDAISEMNVVAQRLMMLDGRHSAAHAYLVPLQDAVTGAARRGILVLLGAILGVLLIAGLNLSILGLANGERRSHDSAVRAALGASRARLLLQGLLQSLLLSVFGGCLGLLAATWSLHLLVHLAPVDLPRVDDVRLDRPVLLFALAATFASAILSGVIPAWRTSKSNAYDAFRSEAARTTTGGAAARRLRRSLIVAESGVSTVLLALAALLGSSFLRLIHVDAGFRATGALSTQITIPWAKYPNPADRAGYYRHLLAAVEAVPGVSSSAVSNALPLQGETWVDAVTAKGDQRPEFERPQANYRFVSAGFFDTLQIPLLSGRTFRSADQGHRVVALSSQLADRLWPGQPAVGRTIIKSDDTAYEVIGIVKDVRADADQPAVPVAYEPYWDWPPMPSFLVVRSEHPIQQLVPQLRAAIRSVDADVPIGSFHSLDDLLGSAVAQRRFELRLAAAFALAALGLAALGIYGVVAHDVARRMREMGIRLALGANPRQMHRQIVWQSLKPVAMGLVIGVGAALGSSRIVASLLYSTNPQDPMILALISIVLGLVAFSAAWFAARTASKLDPVVALRSQ